MLTAIDNVKVASLKNINISVPAKGYAGGFVVSSDLCEGSLTLTNTEGVGPMLIRINNDPRLAINAAKLAYCQANMDTLRSTFITLSATHNLNEEQALKGRIAVLVNVPATEFESLVIGNTHLSLNDLVQLFAKSFYNVTKFKSYTNFNTFPLKDTFSWDAPSVKNWILENKEV